MPTIRVSNNWLSKPTPQSPKAPGIGHAAAHLERKNMALLLCLGDSRCSALDHLAEGDMIVMYADTLGFIHQLQQNMLWTLDIGKCHAVPREIVSGSVRTEDMAYSASKT